MITEMSSPGSALSLADYVSAVDTESQKMIAQALEVLAKEIENNQRLILGALKSYRASVPPEPMDDEFFDLVSFIDKFTANFNENRIDVSVFDDSQLITWQKRSGAPQKSVRQNVMLLLIDTAIERGLLSGVGRLNEWLSFASDSALPGDWLLAGALSEICESSDIVAPEEVLLTSSQKEVTLESKLVSLPGYHDLSVRVKTLLTNKGCVFLGSAIQLEEQELLSWETPNFGRKSNRELKKFLERYGYGLGSYGPEVNAFNDWLEDTNKREQLLKEHECQTRFNFWQGASIGCAFSFARSDSQLPS